MSKNESTTKKPDNIVPTVFKERNYVKAPKSAKSAFMYSESVLWMQNLANLQLDMNNVCCGWIWISEQNAIQANGTERFLLAVKSRKNVRLPKCESVAPAVPGTAHSHIDKMPSCIKDIVVHFIVAGRHFFGGGYNISSFNILVYLNDERVFQFAVHFLLRCFHCAILLHHLLIIVLNYVNFYPLKWALTLPAHSHIVYDFEFIAKHIFSVLLWRTFGKILAKPERLNRDDNVTENPNAWKSVYAL